MSADFDAECESLQRAVYEGRAKIRRLEEEVFELKCARRRQENAEVRWWRRQSRNRPATTHTGLYSMWLVSIVLQVFRELSLGRNKNSPSLCHASRRNASETSRLL